MRSMAQTNSVAYEADASLAPVRPRPWSSAWMLQEALLRYNRVHHAIWGSPPLQTTYKELAEIRERAATITDIDEHLEMMFFEGMSCRPRVIVELGVRDGASTFVFTRVARECDSVLISCDVENCASASSYSRWHFVCDDDVHFARNFTEYCAQLGVSPDLDLLFIDTSHYYDHTVQEIAAWFPLLSKRAKVIFHDTNLRRVGPRRDGCYALGWDNQRGVIRAIEEFLGMHIDERKTSVERVPGWVVRHWPNCNGLTILDRMPEPVRCKL